MAVLSFAQLEELWIQAGGPKVVAPIAAAIALAESSGNPSALNPTDNGGTQSSFGLWQISNGTHTPPDPNWATPAVNARLAVAKYQGAGGNFSPWGTYGTGAYRRYLPSGYVAPATGQIPGATGDAQATLDSFKFTNPLDVASSLTNLVSEIAAIGKVFTAITHDIEWLFVPSHWIRIGCGLAGAAAVGGGTWTLVKAGKSGASSSLAAGILLEVVGGVLLFIAFHNLPSWVRTMGDLTTWISKEITSGFAPIEPAPATPGTKGGQ